MKSSENSQIFYHGTAAETDFTVFDSDLIYLAPNKTEAKPFAENFILAKGKKGTPRILEVHVKPGKIKDIDKLITDALFDDNDIDELINSEALKARKGGYRYLEFNHPGIKNDFTALVSLYPKDDLLITGRD